MRWFLVGLIAGALIGAVIVWLREVYDEEYAEAKTHRANAEEWAEWSGE